MSQKMTIWAICDDRAGNIGQCLGVAEALKHPFTRVDITYNKLAKLPNAILGACLCTLEAPSKKRIRAPWPDLVIAAGRRTAPIARYIKKKSGGRTKLVQIMNPGQAGAKDFDLVCIPTHDDHPVKASNNMTITGAPHRVTQEKLQEARAHWQKTFAPLPDPKIAIILGGATKNREFTPEMAHTFGKKVNQLAQTHNASLLITTSRRTGDAANAFLSEITEPAHIFKWGDEGENPYFGYLACADHIIVTGDSVSMCSEACASGKPVGIYAPHNMVSPKHQRMVNSFCENGHAVLFDSTLPPDSLTPVNITQEIAKRIGDLVSL